MRYILSVLFLIPSLFFAQVKGVVKDTNGNVIPFVSIRFNKAGLYANADGSFKILDRITSDSIYFSCIGFTPKAIATNTLPSTITLTSEREELNDVTVYDKVKSTHQVDFLKTPNSIGNWPSFMGNEIVTYFTPKQLPKNAFFKSISIKFAKIIELKNMEDVDNLRNIVRLNIYTLENDIPTDRIYSSDPVQIDFINQVERKFAIEKEFIKIPKEGICFGIEILGTYNVQKDAFVKVSNAIIRPVLTHKTSDLYNAQSYIKSTLTAIKPVNLTDLLHKTGFEGERFLNFAFEYVVY
ncbi:hypothetical protein NBRC110019_10560 [Neptunitalea chrysea]|uniref:Carboxypeptidase-like regulatory domain-containing protein n=1 Tax=Neptunitalea chrysea TaxID=1647581 RepID=A0A9W6B651_9FLAO|nr:hypothetical protein [Neptunitalea chrysea]GLB52017.1 hypothetical protein NBRC110019_10560 [Neptunitalea chrysea]